MKQDILGFSDVRQVRASPYFVFSVVMLAVGLFAGGFFGVLLHPNGTAVGAAAQQLSGISGGMPTWSRVFTALAETAGWVALVLLLGGRRGGTLFVALILLLRGGLLAFVVAACVTGTGLSGLLLSVVSAGVSAVLSVPALLLAAALALDAGQGHQRGYGRRLLRHRGALLWCGLLLLAAALWRLSAVPVLVALLAG